MIGEGGETLSPEASPLTLKLVRLIRVPVGCERVPGRAGLI